MKTNFGNKFLGYFLISFGIVLYIFKINPFDPNYEFLIFCKKEISYSYINGVNTERYKSRDSSVLIKNKFKIKTDVNIAYNETKGLTKDLIDSVLEKIEEKLWTVRQAGKLWAKINLSFIDNRELIINELKKHRNESDDHIVFSHSQGNLYANIACLQFKENGLNFKNIQIATPASKIQCGNQTDYVTINNDEMYFLVSNITNLENLKKENPSFFQKGFENFIDNFNLLTSVVDPPLKSNISQKKFDAPFFNFEHHSIDNYLSYPPSFSKLEQIYKKTFDSINQEYFIIHNQNYNISCSNISKHLDQPFKSLYPFTIHGQVINPSLFHDIIISKTEKDGTYLLSVKFNWLLFILIVFSFALFFPFFFLILIAVLKEIREKQIKDKPQDQ